MKPGAGAGDVSLQRAADRGKRGRDADLRAWRSPGFRKSDHQYHRDEGKRDALPLRAFGEVRWQNGSTPTDRTLTGQLAEPSGLGSLMDYNAREYSPLLGRFLSADTIVPKPGDHQSMNRYAYVENSPIRFSDSTGHSIDGFTPNWSEYIWYAAVIMAAGSVTYYSDSKTTAQTAQAIRALETLVRIHVETKPQLTNTSHGDTPILKLPTLMDFPLGPSNTPLPTVEKFPLRQESISLIYTTPLDTGSTTGMSQPPLYLESSSNAHDRNVRATVQLWKMNRRQERGWGKYVEDYKSGSGGSEGGINERGDLSWEDLQELAREYLDLEQDAKPSDRNK